MRGGHRSLNSSTHGASETGRALDDGDGEKPSPRGDPGRRHRTGQDRPGPGSHRHSSRTAHQPARNPGRHTGKPDPAVEARDRAVPAVKSPSSASVRVLWGSPRESPTPRS